MKKSMMILCAVLLVLGVIGNAKAITYDFEFLTPDVYYTTAEFNSYVQGVSFENTTSWGFVVWAVVVSRPSLFSQSNPWVNSR